MARGPEEPRDREPRDHGLTPGQLDAALDGARDPVNFNTAHHDDPSSARENTQRSGGGGSGPSTGSAQGGSNSTAGPMDVPEGPEVETGGPRGAGYPPSRTTGGRLDPEGDPHGVEPDEAVKRDTAVFEPGTMRKPQ